MPAFTTLVANVQCMTKFWNAEPEMLQAAKILLSGMPPLDILQPHLATISQQPFLYIIQKLSFQAFTAAA